MKRQLIVDHLLFKPITLNEANNVGGKFFVKGVLQRVNAKNQNGRVYPKEVLEREAKKYLETFIKENRAFGELDHPDSAVIEVKNASHTVEALWWDGDDLWGKLEVLPTPSGNIVKAILQAGKTLGISSRGMGSVKEMYESDTVEVQDDFELLCWDFVSNPSTHGAFMTPTSEGVLTEGAGGYVCTKYCKAESIISEIIRGF